MFKIKTLTWRQTFRLFSVLETSIKTLSHLPTQVCTFCLKTHLFENHLNEHFLKICCICSNVHYSIIIISCCVSDSCSWQYIISRVFLSNATNVMQKPNIVWFCPSFPAPLPLHHWRNDTNTPNGTFSWIAHSGWPWRTSKLISASMPTWSSWLWSNEDPPLCPLLRLVALSLLPVWLVQFNHEAPYGSESGKLNHCPL